LCDSAACALGRGVLKGNACEHAAGVGFLDCGFHDARGCWADELKVEEQGAREVRHEGECDPREDGEQNPERAPRTGDIVCFGECSCSGDCEGGKCEILAVDGDARRSRERESGFEHCEECVVAE